MPKVSRVIYHSVLLLIAANCWVNNTYSQFSHERTLNGAEFNCRSITGGDIDGDGDVDILTCGEFSQKTGWFENLGDGTYSTQHFIYFHGDYYPIAMAAGDFDDDGDLDFTTLTLSSEVYLFENKGEGIFADPIILWAGGGERGQLKVLDIDGDLDLDIIMVERTVDDYYEMSWFENDGVANFEGKLLLYSYPDTSPLSLEVIDMDSDGDLDFLAGLTSSRIFWVENDFDAGFTGHLIDDDWYGSRYFVPIDFDEDGDQDVMGLFYGSPSTLVWYENLGDDDWSDEIILSSDYEWPNYFQVFDIDGDTDLDLIVSDELVHELSWFENLGGGTLGPKIICSGEYGRVSSMFISDIDGDTDLDVTATGGNDLSLLSNTGDSLAAPYILDYNQSSATKITAGDFNGDGTMEVVYSDRLLNKLVISENLGNYTFKYQEFIAGINECRVLNTFDPDNDGDLDLVAAYRESYYAIDELAWHENDGLGNFGPQLNISTVVDDFLNVYPVDVDGDGLIDIMFIAADPKRVSWFKNLGDGLWSTENFISEDTDEISRVFPADLDEDGDLDVIATSHGEAKVFWYENLGGTFGPSQHISFTSPEPLDVFCGDLDGDYDKDIVIYCTDVFKIVWFENLGGGTFSAEIDIAFLDSYYGELKYEDLDNDSDLDILIPGDQLEWYENDGYANFTDATIISNEIFYPKHVLPRDIDGDGDLDLITGSISYEHSHYSIEWYENLVNYPYQFKGELFFDENLNGIRDSTEKALEHMSRIVTEPEPWFSYSSPLGKYFINIDPDLTGYYEVFPEEFEYWSIVTDSLLYHVLVDEDFVYRDSLDFGLAPDTLANELHVNLVGAFPRCNDTINYYLDIQNVGTTFPGGKIHLALHDSITFYNCIVPPDSISGQNYYWHYDSLYYFEDTLLRVEVIMPDVLSLDIPLISVLTVTIDSLPDTVFILSDVLTQSLTCGYDPNDKTADPKGLDILGYIPLDTEEIEYLVRFQNTGNDTAFNVRIEDWLDDYLDWTSIEILSSSHEMSFDISYSGKVTFKFDNIELPDSNVNYEGSQGYVKYRINLDEDLPVYTQIKNFASIYFDLNPAVITNTSINTLWDCQDAIDLFVLNSPVCHNDTLVGFLSNWPESASVNWDIAGIFTSDENVLNWPADSVGFHDLVISVNTDFCSVDSTISIEVIGHNIVVLDTVGICPGDSLLVFGGYVMSEGMYYDTLSSTITGCDSIHAQYVVEWSEITTSLEDIIICEGDSALVFGTYTTIDGIYNDTLASVHGCDSIVTHNVNTSMVEATINGILDSLICLDDLEIDIEGSPFGGTATGPGVSEDYFNPLVAGLGSHYIYYSYTNEDGCVDIDSIKVIVVDCLGLNEFPFDRITIYPNPSSGITTIDFGQSLEVAYLVQIIDVLGKVIYQSDYIQGATIEINVDNFAPGTYVLQLLAADNTFTKVVSRLIVE